MTTNDTAPRRAGTMRVARSRGALSGLLLVLLGIWGALIPFIGPYFSYAFTPANAWTWTAGRFWLEILPGLAAIVGGLMLMTTANRSVGVFAGWLSSAAGAWFVVGPVLGRLWNGPQGAAGIPVGGTARQVWEQIGFFSGLGAVMLFLGALALGRFTVKSVRDVRAAERSRDRQAETTPAAPRTEFRENQVAQPTRTVEQVEVTRPVAEVTRPAEAVTRPEGRTVRTEEVRTEPTEGATRSDALGRQDR